MESSIKRKLNVLRIKASIGIHRECVVFSNDYFILEDQQDFKLMRTEWVHEVYREFREEMRITGK
jgi:hypothetical protein